MNLVQIWAVVRRQFFSLKRIIFSIWFGMSDISKKLQGVVGALTWDPSKTFFLCFGMHPKKIDVHPKLVPKGGVVQFCRRQMFTTLALVVARITLSEILNL